jgi:hypothetical protein
MAGPGATAGRPVFVEHVGAPLLIRLVVGELDRDDAVTLVPGGADDLTADLGDGDVAG